MAIIHNPSLLLITNLIRDTQKTPIRSQKILPAWTSSLFNSDSTSLRLRVQNSSRRVTSSKYLNVYSSAACRNDSQPWFSANIRIPRQFDGSNCFSKNSEHACLTPVKCKHYTHTHTHVRNTYTHIHVYIQSTKVQNIKRCKNTVLILRIIAEFI